MAVQCEDYDANKSAGKHRSDEIFIPDRSRQSPTAHTCVFFGFLRTIMSQANGIFDSLERKTGASRHVDTLHTLFEVGENR